MHAQFKNHRSEVLDHTNKPLRYDVITDQDAYLIVFNLNEKVRSRLECFLNPVERKLVIISQNEDSTPQPPCIFKAPLDANLKDVRIQSKRGIHLISVPRTHSHVTMSGRQK